MYNADSFGFQVILPAMVPKYFVFCMPFVKSVWILGYKVDICKIRHSLFN